jgi:hypothetical protein
MNLGDIAVVLDCAEGTVKVHLHRARQGLARHLDLAAEEGDGRISSSVRVLRRKPSMQALEGSAPARSCYRHPSLSALGAHERWCCR